MRNTAAITKLQWERLGRDLTAFGVRIDADTGFLIEYDSDQKPDCQWRLCVVSLTQDLKTLLHGYPDLEEAKRAAARHMGG